MTEGRSLMASGALGQSAAALLSPRELEYLKLRAQGMTLLNISFEMDISLATVKIHLASVHRKLRVNTTVEALGKVGWISVPGALVTHECPECGQVHRKGEA